MVKLINKSAVKRELKKKGIIAYTSALKELDKSTQNILDKAVDNMKANKGQKLLPRHVVGVSK